MPRSMVEMPVAIHLVRLPDQTLSCAARAHLATAERHAACPHLKRAMRRCDAAKSDCTRRFSAGPKPGRLGFYGELGAPGSFGGDAPKHSALPRRNPETSGLP